MKIVLTGSLGRIGQPLTKTLVANGHQVTVISSKPEKQKEIAALGALAAIGSLEDLNFLVNTFKGADAVYCMIPPHNFFTPDFDSRVYYARLGNNYAQAIEQSGVKRVVHLSSIGAHLDKGTGIILGSHDVESSLNKLSDVAITFMRPAAFYYNLYSFTAAIKKTGIIVSNYGANDKVPWVSPTDIAAVIAEEIVTPLTGRKVRYVASEELTCQQVAGILGNAIGIPDLKWITISDEELLNQLDAIGMPASNAAGLVEMQATMHSGELFHDYYLNKPAVLGKVKMADFAREFATAFQQN